MSTPKPIPRPKSAVSPTPTKQTKINTKNNNYNFTQQHKSPPKFSAEVAAKFDANIREFKNPRRSPKGFLRKGGNTNSLEKNNNNKTSLKDGNTTSVLSQNRNNPFSKDEFQDLDFTSSPENLNPQNDATSKVNRNFQQNPSNKNTPGKRKNTPSSLAGRTKSSERRPRKIFDSSNKSSTNPFAEFERNREVNFETENDFTKALRENDLKNGNENPFGDLGGGVNLWSVNATGGSVSGSASSAVVFGSEKHKMKLIQLNSKLVETQHVEFILRNRIQDLELEQLKLMWKFKNEFEV